MQNKKTVSNGLFSLVHLTGIEPAHLSVLDPKSNASASSATGAYYIFFALVYYNKYFIKFQ